MIIFYFRICTFQTCPDLDALQEKIYHILQRLLPISIRPFLKKNFIEVIVRLSNFFQQICAKILFVKDLDDLQKEIYHILCKLETIFSPALLVVIIHLLVVPIYLMRRKWTVQFIFNGYIQLKINIYHHS